MKKSSVYSRKKAHRQGSQKGSPQSIWAGSVLRFIPYKSGNAEVPAKMIRVLNECLQRICAGESSADSVQDHDELMHAIGTALVRASEIPGGEGVINLLVAGAKVLNYCSTYRNVRACWPVLDVSQKETLSQAIKLYAEILFESTPYQMERAWQRHLASVVTHLGGPAS